MKRGFSTATVPENLHILDDTRQIGCHRVSDSQNFDYGVFGFPKVSD